MTYRYVGRRRGKGVNMSIAVPGRRGAMRRVWDDGEEEEVGAHLPGLPDRGRRSRPAGVWDGQGKGGGESLDG